MDTTQSDRTNLHAAAALLPPLVLAAVLLTIGPDQITVDRHESLMILYFAPTALALLGAIITGVLGGLRRKRGRQGHKALWLISGAGVLLSIPLLVLAAYCILMAGIGTEDGGWA